MGILGEHRFPGMIHLKQWCCRFQEDISPFFYTKVFILICHLVLTKLLPIDGRPLFFINFRSMSMGLTASVNPGAIPIILNHLISPLSVNVRVRVLIARFGQVIPFPCNELATLLYRRANSTYKITLQKSHWWTQSLQCKMIMGSMCMLPFTPFWWPQNDLRWPQNDLRIELSDLKYLSFRVFPALEGSLT